MWTITHSRVQEYRQALVDNLKIELDIRRGRYVFSNTNYVAQQQHLGIGHLNLSRTKKTQHAPPEPNVCLSTSISKLYSSLNLCASNPMHDRAHLSVHLAFASNLLTTLRAHEDEEYRAP